MTAVMATFAGFSCRDEPVVHGLQVRVETCGDEGRHIERFAHEGAPALDEGLAAPLSRLARHWRQTCKACRRTLVERAQFGHPRHQGGGGDGRDAWNAEKNGVLRGKRFVRRDQLGNGGVDGVDVRTDALEAIGILPSQDRQADPFGPVFRRRAVLDQGAPRSDQVVEIAQAFRPDRPRFQLQCQPHARQHHGIGPVGLGAGSKRFTKARLAWRGFTLTNG